MPFQKHSGKFKKKNNKIQNENKDTKYTKVPRLERGYVLETSSSMKCLKCSKRRISI